MSKTEELEEMTPEAFALQLMGGASKIRSAGHPVSTIFFFSVEGAERMPRLTAESIMADMDTKDSARLAERVRELAEGMGANFVFTVTECWLNLNPFVRASDDPDRREGLVVTASGEGTNFSIIRTINPDGTLGEIEGPDHVSTGVFSNLSGREMMN